MTYLIKGQAIGFGAVYDCTDDARREGDKAKRTADKVPVKLKCFGKINDRLKSAIVY